jgi:hypothetical protein
MVVQFLIESVYSRLHDTINLSDWKRILVRKSEEDAVKDFFLECKDNGHSSDYCENHKVGIPAGVMVPQERDIINFLQQCETKGSPDLTPDLSRSIFATNKWREVHNRWDTRADSTPMVAEFIGPTPILKALWQLWKKRKGDIVATP